jgi:hypothetical protein
MFFSILLPINLRLMTDQSFMIQISRIIHYFPSFQMRIMAPLRNVTHYVRFGGMGKSVESARMKKKVMGAELFLVIHFTFE